eukprot:PITA_09535
MTLIVSLNIRGLGVDPKFLTLRDFFYSSRPGIILIKETMHNHEASLTHFRKMLPSWYMVATYVNGLYGGQATLWDPSRIKAIAFKCFAGILISASVRGFNIPLNRLNIYVPYKNKAPFWSKFFSSEIFDIEHLIIAGDFNITLNSDECWGHCRHPDSLADSIKLDLLNYNMVDVVPGEMKPTWTNGRFDQDYIAKRIDRFLVHISIIDVLGMPHSSVENILDPVFNELIINSWKEVSASSSHLPPHTLREKLSVLRKVVNGWEVGNKKKEKMELQHIQQELDSILRAANASLLTFTMKSRIRVLEGNKFDILKKQEAFWWLKSRATWIRDGEKSTKLFHKFANSRRNKNAIWKIMNDKGDTFVSQQDIS